MKNIHLIISCACLVLLSACTPSTQQTDIANTNTTQALSSATTEISQSGTHTVLQETNRATGSTISNR